MRRKLTTLMVAALLLIPAAGLVLAGDEVALTGFITDSYCGKNNANAGGKACALKCYKDGAKLVLFADEQLWELDNQELASKHVGQEVRVMGKAEGKAIQVSEITPAAKKG